MDLFNIFGFITDAANRALYNDKYGCLLRGFTLDASIREVPEQIPLNRIMSLTLHETASFKILPYCLEVRSLRLIGKTDWIVSIVKNITQRNTKLQLLTVITPTIESISEVLTSILSISSLHRLEIRTEEIAESVEVCTPPITISNIEQFILDSSSTID